MKKLFCVLAISSIVCIGASAQGALWDLHADLNGLEEFPQNASPGTGIADAVLDDVANTISLTGSYAFLTANSIAAHIHSPRLLENPPTGTAAVIVPLNQTGGTNGTMDVLNAALTAAQVSDILDNLSYVNVHTNNFSGGEIRGQLLVVPEPSTIVLAAAGLLSALALRRKFRPAAV